MLVSSSLFNSSSMMSLVPCKTKLSQLVGSKEVTEYRVDILGSHSSCPTTTSAEQVMSCLDPQKVGGGWSVLWLTADCFVSSASLLHLAPVVQANVSRYLMSVRYSLVSNPHSKKLSLYQTTTRTARTATTATSSSDAMDRLLHILTFHGGISSIVMQTDPHRPAPEYWGFPASGQALQSFVKHAQSARSLDFDNLTLSQEQWRLVVRSCCGSNNVKLVFGSRHDWTTGGGELVLAYQDNAGPTKLWLDNVGDHDHEEGSKNKYKALLAEIGSSELTCLQELTVTTPAGAERTRSATASVPQDTAPAAEAQQPDIDTSNNSNDTPINRLFQAIRTNGCLQTLDLSYMDESSLKDDDDSSDEWKQLIQSLNGHASLKTIHLGSVGKANKDASHQRQRNADVVGLCRSSTRLCQLTYDGDLHDDVYDRHILPSLELNRFRREVRLIRSESDPGVRSRLFADAILSSGVVVDNESCACELLLQNSDLLVQAVLSKLSK